MYSGERTAGPVASEPIAAVAVTAAPVASRCAMPLARSSAHVGRPRWSFTTFGVAPFAARSAMTDMKLRPSPNTQLVRTT